MRSRRIGVCGLPQLLYVHVHIVCSVVEIVEAPLLLWLAWWSCVVAWRATCDVYVVVGRGVARSVAIVLLVVFVLCARAVCYLCGVVVCPVVLVGVCECRFLISSSVVRVDVALCM